MFKSDKPKEVKKSWDSYDVSFNLEDFVAKASRSATRSKAPARHTAGSPAGDEQIRNPARPTPEDPGKSHADDLRRVIDELKCFDVKAIKQRPDPGAKILRDRINNTLADIFGRKAKEYQDHAIWSLDTLPTSIGGAWHPLSEIQEGYRKGITDAIAMLGSVLVKLEEDLLRQEKEKAVRDQLEKGLPVQEEEKAVPDPGKNRADLRRAIDELTSFDVSTIKQRPDPRAKALTDSINNTLGDIFGRNTKEYHNHAIWSLDTALPTTISGAWQSLSEVREGYRKGITDAVAMLSSVLDKLEKDLPSQEEEKAVIAKVPLATKRGRPREQSSSDPHNHDEQTTKHEFVPNPSPLDLDTTVVPGEDKNLPAHDRKDRRTAKKHNEMPDRVILPETTDSAPGSEVKAVINEGFCPVDACTDKPGEEETIVPGVILPETMDPTPQRRRARKSREARVDAVSVGEKEEPTAEASAEPADRQASPDVMGKSDGLLVLEKPDYEEVRGSSDSGTDWKTTLEALEEKLEQFEAEEPVSKVSDPDLILLGEADALVLDEDVDLAGLVNRAEGLEASSGLTTRRKTALELLEEKLEQFEAEKCVYNGLNPDLVLPDEPDELVLDGDDAGPVNRDEDIEALAIDEDNLAAEKPFTGWDGDGLLIGIPEQGQIDDGALVLDGDDQLSLEPADEPATRSDPLDAIEKKLRELGALDSTPDTPTAEDWIPATIILDESDEEVVATYPETPSARFAAPLHDEHLIESPDEQSEPAPFQSLWGKLQDIEARAVQEFPVEEPSSTSNDLIVAAFTPEVVDVEVSAIDNSASLSTESRAPQVPPVLETSIILNESAEEVTTPCPETPSARFAAPEHEEHLIETPDEQPETAPVKTLWKKLRNIVRRPVKKFPVAEPSSTSDDLIVAAFTPEVVDVEVSTVDNNLPPPAGLLALTWNFTPQIPAVLETQAGKELLPCVPFCSAVVAVTLPESEEELTPLINGDKNFNRAQVLFQVEPHGAQSLEIIRLLSWAAGPVASVIQEPEVSTVDNNVPPSAGLLALAWNFIPQIPAVLETPIIPEESPEEVTAICPETPAAQSALPEHEEHLIETPDEQPETAPVKTLWKKLRNIVRRPVKKFPVAEPSSTSDDLIVAAFTPEVVDVEVSTVDNNLPPPAGLLALTWNFTPQIPAVLETQAGKELLPCVPFCSVVVAVTLPESEDNPVQPVNHNTPDRNRQLLLQVETQEQPIPGIIRLLSWAAGPVASVIQEPEVSTVDNNVPPSAGLLALAWNFIPQIPAVLETPIIPEESPEEVTAICPETPAAQSALPEHEEHLIETPDEQPETAPVKTLWKKLRNIVRRPVKKFPVAEPSSTSDDLIVAAFTPEVVDVEVSTVDNNLPPPAGLLALTWNFTPQIPAVLETQAGKELLPCVPFCSVVVAVTLPESEDNPVQPVNHNTPDRNRQLLLQVETQEQPIPGIIRLLSWTAGPVASVIQEPEQNVPPLDENHQLHLTAGNTDRQVDEAGLFQTCEEIPGIPLEQGSEESDPYAVTFPYVSEELLAGQELQEYVPEHEQPVLEVFAQEGPVPETFDRGPAPQTDAAALPDDSLDKHVAAPDHSDPRESVPVSAFEEEPLNDDLIEFTAGGLDSVDAIEGPLTDENDAPAMAIVDETGLDAPLPESATPAHDESSTVQSALRETDTEPGQEFHEGTGRLPEEAARNPQESRVRENPETRRSPFTAAASSKKQAKAPSADVLDAHIAELQCRIDELKSFDVETIEGRFDPEAKALGDAVNKTLATIYGPDTYAYWQHAITSLDKALVIVGGPKPSPEEIRRAFRRGINDAVAKLTVTLETLNEKRRNLPAEEPDDVESDTPPDSPRDTTRIVSFSRRDEIPEESVARKTREARRSPFAAPVVSSGNKRQSIGPSADVLDAHIAELQCRIDDLRFFDIEKIEGRFDPGAKALGDAINNTLATIYGRDTSAYWRHTITSLEKTLVVVGGPKPSPEEVRRAYRRGIDDAIAKLTATLETLNEKRRNLPVQAAC